MALIKELEVRREDGSLVIVFKNEFANVMLVKLALIPELRKETMNIKGKGEFVVFKCIKNCGYIFADAVEIIFAKEDYIKIVQ